MFFNANEFCSTPKHQCYLHQTNLSAGKPRPLSFRLTFVPMYSCAIHNLPTTAQSYQTLICLCHIHLTNYSSVISDPHLFVPYTPYQLQLSHIRHRPVISDTHLSYQTLTCHISHSPVISYTHLSYQ